MIRSVLECTGGVRRKLCKFLCWLNLKGFLSELWLLPSFKPLYGFNNEFCMKHMENWPVLKNFYYQLRTEFSVDFIDFLTPPDSQLFSFIFLLLFFLVDPNTSFSGVRIWFLGFFCALTAGALLVIWKYGFLDSISMYKYYFYTHALLMRVNKRKKEQKLW